MRRLALVATAALVAGCGVIPDAAFTSPGLPIRVARAGLDIGVAVPGWQRPRTKIVLCATPVGESRRIDLLTTPVLLPGCLEMTALHHGFELSGSYSFRAASATRRGAFDDARDWYVILVGLDQAAPGLTQIRIPGGPVEVQ